MPSSIDTNNSSSSNLEDRHFLSDPRPVHNLKLPTWEVDIYREGVDMPIMTLRVDSTVLPPRKNKKKKILWKLPENVETLPKFGEQDKRRVLEFFREKKKELKKLKNKQRAYRRASSMELNANGKVEDSTEARNSRGSCNGGDLDESISDATKKLHVAEGLPPETNGQKHHEHPRMNKANMISGDNLRLSPESGGSSLLSSSKNNGDRKSDEGAQSPPGFGNSSSTSLPPPPPGIHSSSPLKPAPPGLPLKKNSHISTSEWNTTGYNNEYSASSSPSTSPKTTTTSEPTNSPQNGHQHSQYGSQNSDAPPPPGILNGHHHDNGSIAPNPIITPQQPPVAIGPCFVLPPDAPQGFTIGKFVTETYYLSLRNGLVRQLDAHYYQSDPGPDAAKVCKAVTVGGAHAFCNSQQDRWMQLNTFAGTEMRIKGVQEQPTVGNGILVLITGVSIRKNGGSQQQQQQQQQPQQLPFCHTLILKPVLTISAAGAASMDSSSSTSAPYTTIGYQILNDNLVILTADE